MTIENPKELIPFTDGELRKGLNIPWWLGEVAARSSINGTPVPDDLKEFTKKAWLLNTFKDIFIHSLIYHQRKLLSAQGESGKR